MSRKIYRAVIEVLVEVDSYGEACDVMSGHMTENLSKYNPESSLLDWHYVHPPIESEVPYDYEAD